MEENGENPNNEEQPNVQNEDEEHPIINEADADSLFDYDGFVNNINAPNPNPDLQAQTSSSWQDMIDFSTENHTNTQNQATGEESGHDEEIDPHTNAHDHTQINLIGQGTGNQASGEESGNDDEIDRHTNTHDQTQSNLIGQGTGNNIIENMQIVVTSQQLSDQDLLRILRSIMTNEANLNNNLQVKVVDHSLPDQRGFYNKNPKVVVNGIPAEPMMLPTYYIYTLRPKDIPVKKTIRNKGKWTRNKESVVHDEDNQVLGFHQFVSFKPLEDDVGGKFHCNEYFTKITMNDDPTMEHVLIKLYASEHKTSNKRRRTTYTSNKTLLLKIAEDVSNNKTNVSKLTTDMEDVKVHIGMDQP